MIEWVSEHQAVVWTVLAGLSVAMIAGSMIALPIVIARIPADYFLHRKPVFPRGKNGGAPAVVLVLLRNLAGLVLVIAGIALLVLPGQGVLTILAGSLLLDYPKKRDLELWFLRRSAVRRGVTWIRRKTGRPTLRLPGDPPPDTNGS
jgi:hypothetical protein